MLESLKQLDTNVFLFLNDLHSPFWDHIMYFASGRFGWIPLYAFIIFLIIQKYRVKSIAYILAAILLIVLSDQLSVHLFKNVFERLRPCHNPDIKDFVHLVHNHCGGKYGFVSSHAANTFALATFTGLMMRKRWYTYTLLSWASLVSYSRVYLGVHYPGDIIAGALFGVCLGLLIFVGSRRLVKQIRSKST